MITLVVVTSFTRTREITALKVETGRMKSVETDVKIGVGMLILFWALPTKARISCLDSL